MNICTTEQTPEKFGPQIKRKVAKMISSVLITNAKYEIARNGDNKPIIGNEVKKREK